MCVSVYIRDRVGGGVLIYEFFLTVTQWLFYCSSRDSLTDEFGISKNSDNGDYRKSPAPEDDILGAGAHQRPSGKKITMV